MKLSEEQKEKLKQISMLNQYLGGSKETDQYLMQLTLDTLMPQTDETDKLASLYGVLQQTGIEDPGIQNKLRENIYSELGMDPVETQANNALLEKFKGQFGVEKKNPKKVARNVSLQQQVMANPELASQYYDTKKFSLADLFSEMGPFQTAEERLRKAGFNLP